MHAETRPPRSSTIVAAFPAFTLVLLALSIALLSGCTDMGNPLPATSNNPPVVNADTVDWDHGILPLVTTYCIQCHNTDHNSWGTTFYMFDYDSVLNHTTLRGNPTVVPFYPDSSELIWRVEGTLPPQMPWNLPALPQPEIDSLRTWISQGAIRSVASGKK